MDKRSHTPSSEAPQSEAVQAACICGRFPYPHVSEYLCRIGFNEFLGEVQARLIKAGYNPPSWPDTIRGLGDVDAALDSCVAWCKDRLDEINALRSERPAYPFIAVGYMEGGIVLWELGRKPVNGALIYVTHTVSHDPNCPRPKESVPDVERDAACWKARKAALNEAYLLMRPIFLMMGNALDTIRADPSVAVPDASTEHASQLERELAAAQSARAAIIEECASKVESHHYISGGPGPLYGAGWEAGISSAARIIRSLASGSAKEGKDD